MIGDEIMRSVQFKNRNINMAGNLYLPNGFKESEQYPAIVCVHPGGGVKNRPLAYTLSASPTRGEAKCHPSSGVRSLRARSFPTERKRVGRRGPVSLPQRSE